jgi:hypothetical protein
MRHDSIDEHWCQLKSESLFHGHFTPPLNPLPVNGYGVHTSLYKTEIVGDPPKSPLKKGDFDSDSPLF